MSCYYIMYRYLARTGRGEKQLRHRGSRKSRYNFSDANKRRFTVFAGITKVDLVDLYNLHASLIVM